METHGMKFVVDTTGVAKGFRDYRSAVDGILGSLDKFESKVRDTMGAVERSVAGTKKIDKLKTSIKALGDTKVNATLARDLSKLSKAMREFKAPSKAAVSNSRALFKALEAIPNLSAAARNANSIKSLSSAMAGFKAPSSAQSKRLREFAKVIERSQAGFRALSAIRGISGVANELASISLAMRNLKIPSAAQGKNLDAFARALNKMKLNNLGNVHLLARTMTALSGFKAPTAANIRNLEAFVQAIGRMRVPANANDLANALIRIARAANSASQNMRNLRGSLGSVNNGLRNTSRGARQASVNMMGLQNAFSATFQIGSALRSLFGALTVAELARSFLTATNAALRFKAQMIAISDTTGFAATQLEWVNSSAQRLGLDVLTAENGFGRLSIAANKAGMSVAVSRDIFTGFGTAMTVLGTTTERQNDVLLALQQVMNKGYLSAEELNQQLNEHLPGAMGVAAEYAESLGVTLEEGLKKKMLDAEEVLTFMAKRFKEDFGPALEESLKRPDKAFTLLTNRVNIFLQKLGEAGVNDAIGNLLNEITNSMDEETLNRYATAMGEGLANAIDTVREGIVFLKENWESLEGPISTTLDLIGKWMIVSGSLSIIRLIAIPIGTAAASFGALTAAIATSRAAFAVMTASTLPAAGAAVAAHTGANTALLTSLYKLRAGYTALRVQMTATAASQGIVAAATVGLSAAFTALKAAVVSFIASGGALLVLLAGAAFAAYKMYDSVTTANAAVRDNDKALKDVSKTLESATEKLGIFDAMNQQAKTNNDLLKSSFGYAKQFLSDYAAEMDKATGGLYSMAVQARKTALELARVAEGKALNQLTSMREASGNEWFAAAGEDFMSGEAGRMTRSPFRALRGAAQSVFQTFGAAPLDSEIAPQMAKMRAQLEKARARIAEVESMDPLKMAVTAYGLGFGERKTTPKPGGEDDKPGGGSGSKGTNDAQKRLNELQRMVDQVTGLLGSANPVFDQQQQFMANILDLGESLFKEGPFKKFTEEFVKDLDNGNLSVNSFVEMLKDASNTAPDLMAALEKRGINRDRIGQLVLAMETQHQREMKDAEQALIDLQTVSARQFGDIFGDLMPDLSAHLETLDTFGNLAKQVLPTAEFRKFYQGMVDDGDTASEAMNRLAEAMKLPQDATEGQREEYNKLQRMLQAVFDDTESFTEAQRRLVRQQQITREEAQRSLVFGRSLTDQLDQELSFAAMGAQDARVLRDLSQAIEDNNGATIEQVKLLKQEIEARYERLDLLQRERDLFENNGIRGYINDINQAGLAVAELDQNILQSLEDQLFSLGTTGQFSFQAIFDTIQQGLIRFASQNLIKDMMTGLFSQDELENGQPSLIGGLFDAFGFDTGAEPLPLGSNPSKAMWVQMVGFNPRLDLLTGRVGVSSGRAILNEDGTSSARNMLLGGDEGLFSPGNMERAAGNLDMGLAQTQATLTGEAVATALDARGMLAGQSLNVTDQPPAQTEEAVANAAAETSASFSDTMVGMMPMIGMAFAGSFKSPIAQVAVMFGTMMLQKMLMSGAGGGGIGGILAGVFSEGGVSTNPVSRAVVPSSAFQSAPQFMSGTPFAGGGMPAVLHPNEAVIPLSRGRKVPVEMKGGNSGGGTVVNFNVTAPDPDSFRKSRQQIATDLHMAAQRSFGRNRG